VIDCAKVRFKRAVDGHPVGASLKTKAYAVVLAALAGSAVSIVLALVSGGGSLTDLPHYFLATFLLYFVFLGLWAWIWSVAGMPADAPFAFVLAVILSAPSLFGAYMLCHSGVASHGYYNARGVDLVIDGVCTAAGQTAAWRGALDALMANGVAAAVYVLSARRSPKRDLSLAP
jgi:hypothetical protein